MSVKIKDVPCKKKLGPSWNDMDELKYLICAIDSCKCPSIPSPPSRSIILPPRVEEIPCKSPPRRPPCVPPPQCCPIIPGPCCPRLLSLPIPYCNSCHPCTPLPCYSSK
ncbi:hypothetical protein ALC62_00707 [Cyphomyrmex costatus]|uniref:Uncharacterized protein n=1 Tax=Cyphomyrmex costatus TaxID=456900 RepID=A0A151IQ84_9HYME|nr:hypothetical protein ALC62_00707 [Cyphomyrmex costatus]